jgi:hypothetical protein
MRSVGRDLLFTLIGFVAACLIMGSVGGLVLVQQWRQNEDLQQELMEMNEQARMEAMRAAEAAEAARQEAERRFLEARNALEDFRDQEKKDRK